MRAMTDANLRAAFAGESQAHMRYLIFADRADREGKPNVARLFRAISFAEQIHATKHFRTLAEIKDTSQNLQAAISGETYEVEEMYPVFKAVAELQEEKQAVQANDWALQAEMVHAGMYTQAKQAVDAGRDVSLGDVFICDVCGHTTETLPDKCPLCGAKKESYRKF
ncbi:MAG: rubrerythrin family protein [Dehalococcoidia bacterium]|jgi:rubrerythrin|nr:rubrerythrin family protein [Dehalococcoidia bacterium]MDP6783246.1 rubrerythrin family protein [Dehalococcoidia bacterium]